MCERAREGAITRVSEGQRIITEVTQVGFQWLLAFQQVEKEKLPKLES